MIAKIRTRFKYKIRNVLIMVTVFVFSYDAQPQALKIMPLGNSITQAESLRLSYRYPLWKKLIDDGMNVEYVGSQTQSYYCGNPDFPDYYGHEFINRHEGHWGWRAYQILNGGVTEWLCMGTDDLSTWLTGYTPDVALVHLGSNDVLSNNFGLPLEQQLDTTIWFMEQIIDVLRSDNPNIAIFLAQIIPAVHSQAYKIPLLNAKIPDIAVSKYDPNSPIIIVDQYTGFDPTQGVDTYDKIHPNEPGEEKMAQKWRDAVFNHFGGFTLDLKLYLEGAFTGTEMTTGLTSQIPLNQPFNVSPWNYPGLETVEEIPADIVDWVLVEIRDTLDAASADETTIVGRRAAFLRNDGKIVYLDGSEGIRFVENISNELFVSVHHRNHLPVLTANAMVETDGVYFYDFTVSGAFGNLDAMKEQGGYYIMVAGDMDANGQIDLDDQAIIWNMQVGTNGYLSSDVNLDGQVDNRDKNDFIFPNIGFSSQIP